MKWVEAISTKRLTKDLINGYEILIDAKYFFSRIFKIYLEFIPAKSAFNILMALLEFLRGNLTEC